MPGAYVCRIGLFRGACYRRGTGNSNAFKYSNLLPFSPSRRRRAILAHIIHVKDASCPVPLSSFAALLLCLTALHPASSGPASTPPRILRPPHRGAARHPCLQRRQTDPLELTAFLVNMPKGGDLHMHLSGAVYAETFIRNGATDLLCVNPANHSFFKPPATTRSLPPQPVCGEGNARASDAFKDQRLYDDLVNSFSMRSFVPSAGVSGHDQFFATFGRFGGLDKSHVPRVARRGGHPCRCAERAVPRGHGDTLFSDVAKLSSTIAWPATPVDPG